MMLAQQHTAAAAVMDESCSSLHPSLHQSVYNNQWQAAYVHLAEPQEPQEPAMP
jgi:hypothetical protein